MTQGNRMRPLIVLTLVLAGAATAWQPEDRTLGVVIDTAPGTNIIRIRADGGSEVSIVTAGSTKFLKVPPGAQSLQNASAIAFADINSGDRVLARGKFSADRGSIEAATVVVMAATDLAQKREAEQAEWREKGVAGAVTAVDPAARQVTIRTGAGPRAATVVISGESANVRRYAPDSVRFADAKPSSLSEIRVGDQVRALGERSADESRIAAREIVFGTFRNIAGTVISVDAATNTIVLNDLATKKPLTVHISADSVIRRLPQMMAMMLAQRIQAGPRSGPASDTRLAGPENAPDTAAREGLRGPGRRGNVQQMLEQLPAQPITDLKPGDAVLVASTEGASSGAVTAIALLSGAEPILTAAPRGPDPLGGNWNFSADVAMSVAQ